MPKFGKTCETVQKIITIVYIFYLCRVLREKKTEKKVRILNDRKILIEVTLEECVSLHSQQKVRYIECFEYFLIG